jgi:hypothetical protein
LKRIFLLSPAYAGGKRAQMVLNSRAEFDVAVRLRTNGASVGELFSFISGLYFRGKVAYARAYAAKAYVILAGYGLVDLDYPLTLESLRDVANVPVDIDEPRYRLPLERDARELALAAGRDSEVVLLGSVATQKYIEPLLAVFGRRLLFPSEFVGRGDMSRGGLMLRSAQSGVELEYVPVAGATLRGRRPPKLG